MSDGLDEHLAHYGIKGMKWGKRKASDSSSDTSPAPRREKKELTPSQKKFRRDVALGVAGVAANVAIRKGAQWAVNNPDKIATFMARANNFKNGTKAIGPGYEVFKMTLGASGVYS